MVPQFFLHFLISPFPFPISHFFVPTFSTTQVTMAGGKLEQESVLVLCVSTSETVIVAM